MKKLIFSFFIMCRILSAQVELVSVTNPVYDFLKRMELKGVIKEYNSSMIPISRGEIASYFSEIKQKSESLTLVEENMLKDYYLEFRYDIKKEFDGSETLFRSWEFKNILRDDIYKYLYGYTDVNASLFLNGSIGYSYRNFSAESYPKTSLNLDDIGFKIRGTLYDNFGYYLKVINTTQLSGNDYTLNVAGEYDSRLKPAVLYQDKKLLFTFEGYMRFESSNRAFGFTIGRENIEIGTGYLDKLLLSKNAPPFDVAKLDVKYKALQYSFFYGNLRGDSLGVPLSIKNIVGHRLDILFSNKFKLGVYECLITNNKPFYVTYINPLSALISADVTASPNKDEYINQTNNLIAFDFEIKPWDKVAFQGTLLIDDLNFNTIFKKGAVSNENKFGYQAGVLLVDPLDIPNTSFTLEYTRLDPFVYSHRSNKNTYTHWDVGLGAELPPNSDEIALALKYYFSNRFFINLKYQHQRSGQGIVLDSLGQLIRNYGGDINRGDGDGFVYANTFLMGNRINRDIFTCSIQLEPIRQIKFEFNYSLHFLNYKFINEKYTDQYFYASAVVEF